MNSRQIAYDTYNCSSRNLKVSQSLYHQHNLYAIKTRKPPKIINSKSTRISFKKSVDPVSKYYKLKSDQYFGKKLNLIRSKLVVNYKITIYNIET